MFDGPRLAPPRGGVDPAETDAKARYETDGLRALPSPARRVPHEAGGWAEKNGAAWWAGGSA